MLIAGDQLPTLEAPRVRLRWITDRDVDSLLRIFGDPKVMRYWTTPPFPDRAAVVAYVEKIRAGFSRQDLFQWGVARRADDVVIGTCTLFHLDVEQARAELGYALAHAEWGKGLMSEALDALFDYAFGTLALRRLEADVDPRNAGSLKLLERLGFRNEGFLRERWQVNGEIQDAVFLGLLRREWRRQRGEASSGVGGSSGPSASS